VEEVRSDLLSASSDPPMPAHASGHFGVLQQQFVDITDPCYREVVSEDSSYRGQVLPENDTFHGYGHYRCSEYAIVGHWQNGLAHGHCHQAWADGRSFDGQFQSGSFDGHGRMQWQHPRGVMVYEGEYKDDRKHGHGRFSWPSGRCYDGQWVAGQRHGVGFDISTDGTTCRRVWEDNVVIYTLPKTGETPPPISSLETLVDNGAGVGKFMNTSTPL